GCETVDLGRASLVPGQLSADMNELFRLVPDVRFSITEVHRLDHHGVVVSFMFEGTGAEGLEARWSVVNVYSVAEGQIRGVDIYPDDQLDAALARFEELRPSIVALENACSRALP